MPQTETWTIKRLLEWTAEYFEKNNSDSPRLEAEVLLSAALGCERIQLYTRFDEVPAEPGLGNFRAWVKRRAVGEPVAYLVGHKEFYSLKIKVDSNVLIPRPESEHVVVEAIECAKLLGKQPLTIADVGTGSGCIAVAVAKHIDGCKVTAIDVSPEALTVARENIEAHELSERIGIVESNLFSDVPETQFDLIVSNPPYIGEDEVDTVDENVCNYEPAIALFSGSDGTDLITRLLAESSERLVDGGYLIFETSPIVMDRCLELLAAQAGLEHHKTVRDLAGHQRVVVAKKV